jgi:hypothetical protein
VTGTRLPVLRTNSPTEVGKSPTTAPTFRKDPPPPDGPAPE